jgi:sugar phosphate permease
LNRPVAISEGGVGTDRVVGTARRWAMLGAGTAAQAAAAVMAHGPAFLIPSLVDQEGLSLAGAGAVAAASMLGVMCALVAWGAVTDARGERFALLAGLSGTVVAGVGAVLAPGVAVLAVLLFLGGVAAASTGAASGRVVVGWFPPHRRGLAMGIRQTAQPLGVGIAAATMAAVADRHGPYAALWVPVAAATLAAVAVVVLVIDPARPAGGPAAAPNPYRGDRYLPRVHAVSSLLVVPQFVVWTFALVWLIDDRGWSPAAAGGVVALSQVAGVVGRIGAGQLSDVVGSRMRPLRWVTWCAAATMLALGLAAGLGSAVAVPLVVLATMVTVSDNGLAFTAVAERAGPFWSGRALGLQNTVQYLVAAAVPPVAGLAVTGTSHAAVFALAALFPLAAVALVPLRDERELAA